MREWRKRSPHVHQKALDTILRKSPDTERLLTLRENGQRNWPRGKQRCIGCHEVKSLNGYHFYRDEGYKSGFKSRCIDCCHERQRAQS